MYTWDTLSLVHHIYIYMLGTRPGTPYAWDTGSGTPYAWDRVSLVHHMLGTQ